MIYIVAVLWVVALLAAGAVLRGYRRGERTRSELVGVGFGAFGATLGLVTVAVLT